MPRSTRCCGPWPRGGPPRRDRDKNGTADTPRGPGPAPPGLLQRHPVAPEPDGEEDAALKREQDAEEAARELIDGDPLHAAIILRALDPTAYARVAALRAYDRYLPSGYGADEAPEPKAPVAQSLVAEK